MRQLMLCLIVVHLAYYLAANSFVLPPMPLSRYPDTEISTNILFNSHRTDVSEFELKFILGCSSSNCIQVAFGRDDDNDGILSLHETDTVYGWRNGQCFIEDAERGVRYSESVSETLDKELNFAMRISSDRVAKGFSADVNGAYVFQGFSKTHHSWLYRPEWNLMRVTRRGVSVPSEWVVCNVDYAAFLIIVK